MAHQVAFGRRDPASSRIPLVLRRIVTFHLICLGWLIFRLPTLGDTAAALVSLGSAGFQFSQAAMQSLVLLAMAIGLGLFTTPSGLRDSIVRLPSWLQGLGYAGLLILIYLTSASTQRFIYFQF